MYYYFGFLINNNNKTVMAFSASVNTIFLGSYLTFYNCIIYNKKYSIMESFLSSGGGFGVRMWVVGSGD